MTDHDSPCDGRYSFAFWDTPDSDPLFLSRINPIELIAEDVYVQSFFCIYLYFRYFQIYESSLQIRRLETVYALCGMSFRSPGLSITITSYYPHVVTIFRLARAYRRREHCCHTAIDDDSSLINNSALPEATIFIKPAVRISEFGNPSLYAVHKRDRGPEVVQRTHVQHQEVAGSNWQKA